MSFIIPHAFLSRKTRNIPIILNLQDLDKAICPQQYPVAIGFKRVSILNVFDVLCSTFIEGEAASNHHTDRDPFPLRHCS